MPKKKDLDTLISIRSSCTSPVDFDEVYYEIASIEFESEVQEELTLLEIRKERESVHSLSKIHFAVRQKERDEK